MSELLFLSIATAHWAITYELHNWICTHVALVVNVSHGPAARTYG